VGITTGGVFNLGTLRWLKMATSEVFILDFIEILGVLPQRRINNAKLQHVLAIRLASQNKESAQRPREAVNRGR
jgi:hypothetical protein